MFVWECVCVRLCMRQCVWETVYVCEIVHVWQGMCLRLCECDSVSEVYTCGYILMCMQVRDHCQLSFWAILHLIFLWQVLSLSLSRSTPVTLPTQLLEHSLIFLKTASPVSVSNCSWGWGLLWSGTNIQGVTLLNKTNSPCLRSCKIPNSPLAIGVHLPYSMLGFCLTRVCTGLMHAVTIMKSSYVHLPFGVQKTMFPYKYLPFLALTFSIPSSLKNLECYGTGMWYKCPM